MVAMGCPPPHTPPAAPQASPMPGVLVLVLGFPRRSCSVAPAPASTPNPPPSAEAPALRGLAGTTEVQGIARGALKRVLLLPNVSGFC